MRHPSIPYGIYSGTFSSCHPGLEPGSISQSRERFVDGPRLKAGVTVKEAAPAVRSTLPLRSGLVDLHRDAHLFVGATLASAADRRGAEIVETGGDPHVAFGRADTVGGVEPDPA